MITIIIPTSNSEKFLDRCLNSVHQQRNSPYELIIVDNCSTDQTHRIVNKFSDIVDKYISEPDAGNYDAINKAILFASGNWVYILGADDFLLHSRVLFNAYEILKKFPQDIYIAYGNVNVVNDKEELLYSVGSKWDDIAHLFKSKMMIPHQGVFHRIESFTKFGLFDMSFKYAGDYEFLLRIVLKYPPKYMNMGIAGYRFTGRSSRVMTALKVQREYRLAQIKNSCPITFRWFLGYVRTMLRLIVWNFFGFQNSAKIDDFIRSIYGKPKIWTKLH